MKHIKLFESFKSPSLAPADISIPGDRIFCWNFEDGWEVALVGKEYADVFEKFLLERETSMVKELSISRSAGIAYVATGIPYDLSVNFEGPEFELETVKYAHLINLDGVLENSSLDYSSSCVFNLKRDTVMSHKWNGGDVIVETVENYLRRDGEKTKIELNLEGSNPDENYSGTVVGVGNTPREAAMYCIMAAVTLIGSGDTAPVPQDLNNFKDVVEDFILEEELEEALNLLERGEVLTGNFGYSFLSGSDYIKAEASIEEALPSADIGGFIVSYYHEEEG